MRDDDIDELAGKIEELDELLHGQRSRNDSGLVGHVNEIETALNSLLRVMHPDHTGKGGLINEFHDLKRQVQGKHSTIEYRWKYWTAISVALITSIGLFVQNWPSIREAWSKPPQSETGKMIYKAKHPRIKKYKVRVIPAPPPKPSESSISEDNPYGSF